VSFLNIRLLATYDHGIPRHCSKLLSVCNKGSRFGKRIDLAARNSVEVLVVKHNVEKRTVDLKLAVITNEAQLSKPVHKEIDSRTSCAHHLR
jgi:hypothetical protein